MRPGQAGKLTSIMKTMVRRIPSKRSKMGEYATARMLLMGGRHREAMRELRRVLRRNPKDADALYQLARVKLEMGRTAGARKLFGKCARLDKQGKWSREIVLHLRALE